MKYLNTYYVKNVCTQIRLHLQYHLLQLSEDDEDDELIILK